MSPLVGGMLYNELVNLSGRIVTGFLAFRVAYGHKQAQNPQLEVSASSPERRTPARKHCTRDKCQTLGSRPGEGSAGPRSSWRPSVEET